ncbi:MAG: DUF5119 domain-containing protein [Prevotella sp.]|nr:DUF5119 domain-containing protein [Prevotella sp.]
MKNRYIIICSLAMMTIMSCELDHLYYQTVSRDKVRFNIDWSKTNFAPESKGYDEDNKLNGVTIFAFDSATHKLVTELPPDANWQSPVVKLDQGTYDMVLINDSRVELPSIRFDMESPFEEFSAYTLADTVYADQPEYLAVSAVRNVSFHPEKKEYYYDMPEEYYRDYVAQVISTVQKAVTKRINVKVYVKGMNYCKGMQRSYITGLAKSVNLVTRKPSKDDAVYGFNLVNREFRSSDYTEAVLTQSLNCFGFNEAKFGAGDKFELIINFVLVDNSIHTVTADVTEQFEQWYEEHKVDIDLDLDLDIDLDIEVELPPTVEDPEETGGFAPETVPWNDIVQDIIL